MLHGAPEHKPGHCVFVYAISHNHSCVSGGQHTWGQHACLSMRMLTPVAAGPPAPFPLLYCCLQRLAEARAAEMERTRDERARKEQRRQQREQHRLEEQ